MEHPSAGSVEGAKLEVLGDNSDSLSNQGLGCVGSVRFGVGVGSLDGALTVGRAC